MKIKLITSISTTAKTLTLASVLLLSACNTSNVNADQANENNAVNVTAEAGIIHISNEKLQTLIDKKITLIDIRRPEEWAETGVVPGSKKLTFFSSTGAINPKLVPTLKKIAPADKPVILICRTGNRTRVAALMIKAQLGYTTVYNVEHGITKWIADGRKTVK